MRWGHVDKDVDRDVWVVCDEVWELCWTHIDMEYHFFISCERLEKLLSFVLLEGRLTRTV